MTVRELPSFAPFRILLELEIRFPDELINLLEGAKRIPHGHGVELVTLLEKKIQEFHLGGD